MEEIVDETILNYLLGVCLKSNLIGLVVKARTSRWMQLVVNRSGGNKLYLSKQLASGCTLTRQQILSGYLLCPLDRKT